MPPVCGPLLRFSVVVAAGFLCDEMGLGKSLQSIMLILSHPAPENWAVR